LHGQHTIQERKRRKRKKEKQFEAKTRRNTLHGPTIEEDDTETNQMMWQNHGYNLRSQPHALQEGGVAANALMREHFVFWYKN
jgi:hypothetical protein